MKNTTWYKALEELLKCFKIMNISAIRKEISYIIGSLIGETIQKNVYSEKKLELYSGTYIT